MTTRHARPMAEYRRAARLRTAATIAGYVLVLAVFIVDAALVLAMPVTSAR